MGIEAKNGLGKSIDSTWQFPSMLQLGSLRNDSLIYEVAAEIAREMKMLGLHINFAPPAERMSIQTYDPQERSFGDNKFDITRKALAYMAGLQDN
jgi:beta-glucosidase-like glycosyl hydrolase